MLCALPNAGRMQMIAPARAPSEGLEASIGELGILVDGAVKSADKMCPAAQYLQQGLLRPVICRLLKMRRLHECLEQRTL